MDASNLLFAALASVALLSLGIYGLTALATLASVRSPGRKRSPRPASEAPPISILKPLKGAGPDLYDNLAAVARQDYPAFEMILGTADPDDPALAVARRLAADFPHLPITVVTGAPDLGFNPKVSNLAHLARHARHDWILISDADVRPDPGYLAALAGELADPRVELVSSLLTGCGEASLGAAFENLHLNGFVAPAVCSAQVLADHPCVVGKSMLLRRSTLEGLGSWERVKDVLAEDYILGRILAEAGHRVALSLHPLRVFNRQRSFEAFRSRHLRWAQMRRRISPLAYPGELLLNPVPWILAAGLAAGLAGAAPAAVAAAVTLLAITAKAGLDGLLARVLRGRFPALRHLALVPLKDLVIFALWPLGAVRRTLDWRGNPLTIGPGSVLTAGPAALDPDAVIQEVLR